MDIKPIKICVRFFISDTLRKSFKQKHIIILMSVVFNCLLFSNLFQHSLINAQTMRLVNSKTGHWKALGPIYPVVSTEVGTGRVTCVAISPSNSRTLFIGTPGAGIWKSTDEGVSWNRFKNVPYKNLSIYDIEFDPINSRHIIACTGDPDRKHGFSYGLLETFNGGESWVVNPVNFENGSNLVEDADIFFLYKILFIPDSDNLIRRDTITRNLYLSTYYIESGNTMNGSFIVQISD